MKTKFKKLLFLTYAFLSVIFIIMVNQSIFSSIPTVQEKAFGRWFKTIEPLLWASEENRASIPLPVITISTPSAQYACASKEYGCAVSINQEQILRYLRLLDVSRAMRFSRFSQHNEEMHYTLEFKIYQDIPEKTAICETSSESNRYNRRGLSNPLFSGLVIEKENDITLRNLLSLVERSCFKFSEGKMS